MEAELDRLAGRIGQARSFVAFTGAGISTESGIPDYRSQGGIWDRYRPVVFDQFLNSRADRVEYWRRRVEMQPQLAAARPNAAHRALAQLHRMGRLAAVVTQNIDGLHQAAGMPADSVVELHGNTRRIRCLTCRGQVPESEVMARIAGGDAAPECSCGGLLKPDTISFGQSLAPDTIAAAMGLARGSDLFLVVGSTLVVHPAAALPGMALEAGAYLSIVNLSATPYDDRCHLRIQARAGRVLEAVARRVRHRPPPAGEDGATGGR